ncbi:Dps family protein [Nibrella viscosa]|uniref:Dps family protein n=1 Tax=Nibrella viscosa TaxID=1084524 RepID=A0ABP8KWG8_9BACT
MVTNQLGLEQQSTQEIASRLNKLLASYQVFYINARGFHWNIKGEKFFELHAKFEELYNDLQLKNDELAERILTLGAVPFHSYSDYLTHSSVPEAQNISDGKTAIEKIRDAFSILLPLQRAILQLAGEANDEGTNALMSDYIRQQEKMVWMYNAYLNA